MMSRHGGGAPESPPSHLSVAGTHLPPVPTRPSHSLLGAHLHFRISHGVVVVGLTFSALSSVHRGGHWSQTPGRLQKREHRVPRPPQHPTQQHGDQRANSRGQWVLPQPHTQCPALRQEIQADDIQAAEPGVAEKGGSHGEGSGHHHHHHHPLELCCSGSLLTLVSPQEDHKLSLEELSSKFSTNLKEVRG